ncbi:MAG TPA: nuclear transport factor 2 family protein [Mycobacteriales bacterium]|nr:nuclear transport factor 2 family protein [Mycobacteriales bacterium]
MSFAEVAESVRNTIAAYTHALDDGRVDDVVATFWPEASIDLAGMGAHEGEDALRAAYTKWKPRGAQRHLVLNTHITSWSETEASATSDVVFLFRGEAGWAVHMVGRYTDELRQRGGEWRFSRRTAEFTS